jgi:hypothetical protein
VDGRSYTVEVRDSGREGLRGNRAPVARAQAHGQGDASPGRGLHDGTPVQSKLPCSVLDRGEGRGFGGGGRRAHGAGSDEDGDRGPGTHAVGGTVHLPRRAPGEEVPAGHELARIRDSALEILLELWRASGLYNLTLGSGGHGPRSGSP